LSFNELNKIINSPGINTTWVTSLSSVNGVYLIQDKETDKLYVGSAYGDNGIYGRWASYSKNENSQTK
jgi:excinuclease UvrABC nuclease subunit